MKHESGFGGWLWAYLASCVIYGILLYSTISGSYDVMTSGRGTMISVIFFVTSIIMALILLYSLYLLEKRKRFGKELSIIFLALSFILLLVTATRSMEHSQINSTLDTLLVLMGITVAWIFYFFLSERVGRMTRY